jgi:hypothetical protein
MLPAQNNQSGAMNLTHLGNTATNIVEAFCSIFAMPLEMMVRPLFGSQYYDLPVYFFSALLMIALPLLSVLSTAVVSMIPFTHPAPTIGMFGIDALAKLFFLMLIVTAVRLYRRILNPASEQHSRYEGPPLPLFSFLPGSDSFWRVRIVYEPVFIFLVATVLQDLFIFQSGLTLYLRCAAGALVAKNSINFFRSWKVGRDLMDIANASPVLSRLVDNKASREELVPLHIATLPDDLSPETRRTAALYIAQAYNPNFQPTQR